MSNLHFQKNESVLHAGNFQLILIYNAGITHVNARNKESYPKS